MGSTTRPYPKWLEIKKMLKKCARISQQYCANVKLNFGFKHYEIYWIQYHKDD